MRTTPELSVPDPYELIAMKSHSLETVSRRIRSPRKKTAPLSTPISSRSRLGVVAGDLGGELADALLKLVRADQDVRDESVGVERAERRRLRHGLSTASSSPGRARAWAATATPGTQTSRPSTSITG